MAETTVDLGTYAVVQGDAVEVRVAVTGPVLKDLQVSVAWDPALVSLAPGTLWVNASRLYNDDDAGATAVPGDFMTIIADPPMVRFRLHQSAEVGDSGWRVDEEAAGGAQTAVFGFSLTGQVRGTAALAFPAGYPPYARNTCVFCDPVEAVTATTGSVLVYLPAGPVQIAPPGGSFNRAIEVVATSANAIRLVYTLDGTVPDANSAEFPSGQALFVDGADGEDFLLQVLAFGEAGPTQSGQAVFRFDMVPPSVTVTPLATSAARPVLSGTVSDGTATVVVTVAGASAAAVSPGDGTWSLDLSGVLGEDLAEGVYDVSAVATDPAGNSAVDLTAGELTVDWTSPQGTFVVGIGNPAYLASPATVVAIAVTGATEMRFRSSGEEWGTWVAYATSLDWVLTAGDGTKTVQGEFRDAARNLLSVTDSVVLDTGLPVSDIATSGTYGPLTWPGEVRGTAADGLSGIARVEVQCRRVDTGEYWSGSAWSPTETWLTAAGSTSWSLELDASAVPGETSVTVYSRAVDRAGNLQAPEDQSSFVYDANAPDGVFSIEAPAAVAVATRSVTLHNSVTGATQMRFREGAGAWTAWLSFAATYGWTLVSGDGRKTVSASFRDAAANVTDLTDDILLDQTPPVSSVGTTGGYGPTSWPGYVTVTAADATSGVAGVNVAVSRLPVAKADPDYWDGAGWVATETWLPAVESGGSWSVALPLAALDDGRRYGVSARAHDLAGNTEATGGAAEFLFDSSVPTGGFAVGSGNPLYVNSTSVTLYCSVTANNPVEMRFRNEGEAFPATWTAYAATVAFTLPAGNGLKTVYAEFHDTVLGSTLATTDTATLDLDAPSSGLNTSGAFGPLSWPGAVSGTATDTGPSGAERVDVSILRGDGRYWNGSDWQADSVRLPVAVVGGVWSLALPASALTDGAAYAISSQAVDRAGNQQAVPALGTVQFDSSAPTGSFSIGAGNPVACAARDVTLAMSVSNATEMAFRNAGGAWSEWQPVASALSWQLIGGDGEKQVSGRFRDSVGNLLEVVDTVVLDTTPPAATLGLATAYGPQPTSWSGAIAGTAFDSLSGLAAVQVQVQRRSDGLFWSGTVWAADAAWLGATGLASWQLALASAQLTSGTSYSVAARATDVAGNTQAPPATGEFLYDAGLPSSTVSTPGQVGVATWPGGIEGTATDALTGVALVSVRLRRVIGGEVSYWNGTAWELENDALWLDATGTQTWRLEVPLASLTDGASYTAASRAVDLVGNVQSPLTSRLFVYDGVAPAAPTLTGIMADTGAAADLITSDRTLLFSGYAEGLVTIEVRVDGVLVGAVQSSAGGTWTFDHTGYPLAAGQHTVQLAAVDAAGNRSSWSGLVTVTVDPVAPVLTCGFSPGARVNGTAVISFTTDGSGAVGASLDQSQWVQVQSGVSTLAALPGFAALAEGAFALTLRDTDLAGNEGRVQVALTKDTVAPAGYGIAISQSRINIANRHALTFVLTAAEAGSTCEYSVTDTGGASLGGSFAVLAATQTSPALDVSGLADGALTVQARLRDTAGNAGTAVADEVEKDTVAPSGYTLQLGQAVINAGNQTALSFTVSGAEVPAICAYTVVSTGGGQAVSGSLSTVGGTTYGGPLAVSSLGDGVLTVSVWLTDSFGNQGAVVTGQVPKDVVMPVSPQVAAWTQPVNQANAAAFAFSGTAEASSTVLFQVDSSAGGASVTGAVTVDAAGHFSVTGADLTALGDGTVTLSVSGRDPAGNQTAFAAVGTAAKDTVPPATPVLAAVTQSVNAGAVTAFAFAGTADPGVTLTYVLASAAKTSSLSGSLTAGQDGAFAASGMDISALPDGVLELRLTAWDTVGNASTEQVSGPIIKDTVTPVLEVLSPSVGGSVSGDEVLALAASDAVTFQVTFDGVAWFALEPGVTALGELPPFAGLAEGLFSVALRAEDGVGNASTVSLDFVKDTAAPAGYTVSLATAFVDASAVHETAFTILGGEVGAAYVYDLTDAEGHHGPLSDGGLIMQSPQEVAGVFIDGLAQGTLTLTVRLTDAAGNTGPEATAQTVLGTTAVVALTSGWNAVGVTVAPVESSAEVCAEAASRPDGALLAGPFFEYVDGRPVPLAGTAAFAFGRAYRVYVRRAGTLRIRGVAGAGVGALSLGWNFIAPGMDTSVAAFAGSAVVWSDPRPGMGYRRLTAEAQVRAGEAVWLFLAP